MRSANTALSGPALRHQRIVLLEQRDGASFVSRALAGDGYIVDRCCTAADTLEFLNARPVDVVVVDLCPQEGEGAELCSMLRRDPLLCRVPLVALVDPGSVRWRTLADAALVRPFDEGELLVAIERALLRAERRVLSLRLEETERLSMLGTLAASIGHELNNPLAFAIGNLDLAHDAVHAAKTSIDALLGGAEFGDDEKCVLARRLETLLACFQDGSAGLHRVRAMVGDLVGLTRARSAEQRLVDVRRVIESSLTMAKGQLADRAIVTCEYGEAPKVMGDEPRLGQLFVNLLVNAAQSIPAGDARSNSIHVCLYEHEGSVVVEIEDTGGGMSKTQLTRIFEPFFTTKAELGTGLGLSICRDIVEEHGGELDVESELGRGSRFSVRFAAAR